MKLFLDSANLQDVENGLARGDLSGITTNPSLLAKEPKANFYEPIKKIAALIEADGRELPLSVEVFATKPDEMVAQAQDILEKIPYSQLNIKIPIGWDELKAIYALSKKGIKVNCTCIFTEEQCVLAANAGASYVSIFHCRLKDIGGDRVKVISGTRQIFDQAGHDAEIIVGSIRMQTDILEAHLAGISLRRERRSSSRWQAIPQRTNPCRAFSKTSRAGCLNDGLLRHRRRAVRPGGGKLLRRTAPPGHDRSGQPAV